MRRFHITDIRVAREKAVALKHALKEQGHAARLGECQALLAHVYGYSSWGELRMLAGRSDAKGDRDLRNVDVQAAETVLAAMFRITAESARMVLATVNPDKVRTTDRAETASTGYKAGTSVVSRETMMERVRAFMQLAQTDVDQAAPFPMDNAAVFDVCMRTTIDAATRQIDIDPSATGGDIRFTRYGRRRSIRVDGAGWRTVLEGMRHVLFGMAHEDLHPARGSKFFDLTRPWGNANGQLALSTTEFGPSFSIRLFPGAGEFTRDLDMLNLDDMDEWRSALEAKSGLVAVSGGTGSGKTCTLLATAEHLATTDHRRVAMFASPPERWSRHVDYYHQKDFDLVSPDYDVVIFDLDLDRNAVAKAMRLVGEGKLVFLSLHQMDRAGVVAHLAELGADPDTVSKSLLAVLVQKFEGSHKLKQVRIVTRLETGPTLVGA